MQDRERSARRVAPLLRSTPISLAAGRCGHHVGERWLSSFKDHGFISGAHHSLHQPAAHDSSL